MQDRRGRVSGEAQTLGDVLTGPSVVICQTRTEAAADAARLPTVHGVRVFYWRPLVLGCAVCVVLYSCVAPAGHF